MTALRAAVVLGAAGLFVVAPAHGDPPDTAARLSCEHRSGKGRVVCELELEASQGRLVWADAVVAEVPSIARALKSRVGFKEATVPTERRVRLPIGIVATRLGEGPLVVKARAVVCTGPVEDPSCTPVTRTASTILRVGPLGRR